MPFDASVFDVIESSLRVIEIDDIKMRLQTLIKGYYFSSPVLDAGKFLYRARKLGNVFCKSLNITYRDLIYPPAHLAKLGRLNRPGTPIFYSSLSKESVFFELGDLNPGDEIILIFWRTTKPMYVSNIGYTEFAFRQLGAIRPVPRWGPPTDPRSPEAAVSLSTLPSDVVNCALSKSDNRELNETFSRYFMQHVTDDESFRYKLTVAIGELHLGHIPDTPIDKQFSGVLYPSVRMWANGDNIALLPWFVDEYLEFCKAAHVLIKSRAGTSMGIEYVDEAMEFDGAGRLKWLGRTRDWCVKPQTSAVFLSVLMGGMKTGTTVEARMVSGAM